MNARDIIAAVCSDRYQRGIVVPNYVPAGWWENDVMEITEAGLWHEFEIKVSRTDYFADAEKEMFSPEFGATVRKHDMLATRRTFGPNRFTFVIPYGLVKFHEIPAWAGLIEVWKQTNGKPKLLAKKPATLLHSVKLPESAKAEAYTACYWRMHSTGRAMAHHAEMIDGQGI